MHAFCKKELFEENRLNLGGSKLHLMSFLTSKEENGVSICKQKCKQNLILIMFREKFFVIGFLTLILPIRYNRHFISREENKFLNEQSVQETQPESHQLKTKAINRGLDLENWMTQLPHHLTAVPIIYLSIPGIYTFLRRNCSLCKILKNSSIFL